MLDGRKKLVGAGADFAATMEYSSVFLLHYQAGCYAGAAAVVGQCCCPRSILFSRYSVPSLVAMAEDHHVVCLLAVVV